MICSPYEASFISVATTQDCWLLVIGMLLVLHSTQLSRKRNRHSVSLKMEAVRSSETLEKAHYTV
jgi:hypothetical protein